mmetsp:Transcript_9892/g.25145  ORF Transcript_9892/g.25145 Transcript_9892/m.25145 type:complete len:96 (+) Transcript_9892:23-310(+)
MDWWRENVIKPIHRTRIKLPPIFGIPAYSYMRFFYPIPIVVGGYYVMQWAIHRSHENIGVDGEKLRDRKDLRVGDVAGQNAALRAMLDDIKSQRR